MQKQAIHRSNVDSSMIKSVGHSFPRRMLEIEFKDGSVYRYQGVNKRVFKALLSADSKGKYFHSNIKAKYPYKKYQAKDGSKTGDEYHMKTAQVREYDEFCKIAKLIVRDGQVIDPHYYGANRVIFKETPQAKVNMQPAKKSWEPAKPLTKAQAITAGALLLAGGGMATVDAIHKISKKRKLKKKKHELIDAGWMKEE